MTVAFVCAMPMELDALAEVLELAPGTPYRTGGLDGVPVVATASGMGTALARTATERLLSEYEVEHLFVVGICGAIDATPIGAVLVPASVVDAATGTEYPHEPPGTGILWTGDALVTDPADLAALVAKGVVALDMETAAIADVCTSRGIPWSVVRAVSDNPGDVDEELFRTSNQDGTPDRKAVARYRAAHPDQQVRLAELGRNAKRACQAAAEAAAAAARELRTRRGA